MAHPHVADPVARPSPTRRERGKDIYRPEPVAPIATVTQTKRSTRFALADALFLALWVAMLVTGACAFVWDL